MEKNICHRLSQFFVWVMTSMIRLYQGICRPMMKPCCRFYPSCSDYALSALKYFGLFKGLGLAVWRIMRCHPWAEGGYDPVMKASENERRRF